MIAYLLDKYFIKQPRFRQLVTKLLYGNRSVVIDLLGEKILINTNSENGYYRASRMVARSSLFRDEFPIMTTLSNMISNDISFIDVGANIGIYSILFAKFKKIHPDFKIFSFEVNPETFIRLKRNADSHGFKAFNIALGNENCEAEFVGGAVSHVTTRIELANSYNLPKKSFSANIATLSSFEIPAQLLMKIDVEGQELAVLEGARVFFDDDRVKGVYLDGYGERGCWDFLRKYGFDLLDGRTLTPANRDTFSLLALKKN